MTRAVTLLCLMPLAACDLAPESREMRPGQWRTTSEVVSVDAPHMPPAAVEQIKASMAKTTVETCMTDEMIRNQNAAHFAPKATGCNSDAFDMGDGKISAKMSCNVGGAKQDMSMDGTYAPESYLISTTLNSSSTRMGDMKMVIKMQGKRIGDC